MFYRLKFCFFQDKNDEMSRDLLLNTNFLEKRFDYQFYLIVRPWHEARAVAITRTNQEKGGLGGR